MLIFKNTTNIFFYQFQILNSEIRQLVEQNINDKYIWISLNDRGQEGDFRLLNGTHYDVTDISQPALYRWHSTEPNNKFDEFGTDENCVLISNGGGNIGLNDYPCDKDYWVHDTSIRMYGLCEISTYICIPSI